MPGRSVIFQILLLSMSFLAVTAQTHFSPTTTLTAETGNNTSAADNFAAQPNGNMTPGNVSKVPLQSLLYPGSTAKLYAHLVQWFGYGDHVDVGYVSGDALQVQKQVADMISRGLDGAIIDWYGRGEQRKTFRAYDMGTQLLMHEAEQHPGFSFAVMADVGANKDCEHEHGCDPIENLIEDLNYAYRTYEQSPAYLKSNDRPVVFFFGQQGHGINWKRVRSRVAGNPLFIFRNSGAFVNEASDGGFSWVSPSQTNEKDPMALNYLVNYYATAQRHDSKFSLGSAYKGFDDSIALWGEKRLIDQQCGQTWLQSIAEANQFYSEKQQMLGIQLVTWNDYEEGTEFETGISNCINLTSWTRGASVFWNVKGDASTIDHFTVFVSQDGENLMPIADLEADTRSLNLSKFRLDNGAYTVYVKAVGKPSLSNEMSEGRRITISNQVTAVNDATPLNARLSVTTAPAPASITVTVGDGPFLPDQIVIDFGDGTVVTGQVFAQHTYKLPGVYTVMVTVTNGAGMRTTQTAAMNVTAP